MKGWCYTQRLLQTELRNGTKSSQSGWGWVKATWFTHLLKQGHPGPRPDGFWVSPRTETPHLPWTNCASAQAPSIKTGFLMFRGASVFSFAPISSDPVTGHHWTFLNDFSFGLSGQKTLQVLPSFGLQCDRQLYLFTFISSPAIKWSVLFLCLIACGRQGCSLYSELQCSKN